MLVLEAKLKGKEEQYGLIEEAMRTALFCRNKALRYWMDNEKVSGYDLNKQMAVLAKGFDFANCKKKISVKKGFPKFKKRGNSVEYKKTGWTLSNDRKYLTF